MVAWLNTKKIKSQLIETDPVPAPSSISRIAAYGRFKSRFKPGHGILAFHNSESMTILDISDVGFKLKSDGRFQEKDTYVFDVVFHEETDISGWRLRAQCRWATGEEAGFLFLLDRWGQAISTRIARQHLRGRMKILNGIEL